MDLMPDTLGKGAAESNLSEGGSRSDVAAVVQRVASTGYMRNKLTVLQGGAGQMQATALSGALETAGNVAVATTLAAGLHATTALTPPDGRPDVRPDVRMERIRTARMKGYEGDSCGECGNFTLVRNGTCLKCDTCGGTSGCS